MDLVHLFRRLPVELAAALWGGCFLHYRVNAGGNAGLYLLLSGEGPFAARNPAATVPGDRYV